VAPTEIVSVENVLEKLLRGELDTNMRFDEICQLLQAKGFRIRVSGSPSYIYEI